MKLILSICLFSLFFLNTNSCFSQMEGDKSGTKYEFHLVRKGETTFSICQKYKVTPAELKAANPDFTAVLKIGTTIRIPVKKSVEEQKQVQAIIKTSDKEPEYYYHKVNKNQTILTIAKQYGITAKELIKYNPEITKGLVLGQVLKVPVINNEGTDVAVHPEVNDDNAKSPASDSAKKYKVEKGETLFSLASRFGVTVDDLKKANPLLVSRGLEAGETILVPNLPAVSVDAEPAQNQVVQKVTDDKKEPEAINCVPFSGKNTRKYKAALLLPLYLQGNDQTNPVDLSSEVLQSKIDFSKVHNQVIALNSDSVAFLAGINIDQRAESFLEFYEGALLALDSLQQSGMNIELYVFDASNQKTIGKLLQMDVFRDLDLIIGPVYPELQEQVAAFSSKNRIPMVSPLASNGNFEEHNSWYFKVNPTKEFQVAQTAQFIADEFGNKNLMFLQTSGNANSPEMKLNELSKAKLMAARQSAKSKKDLFHEYNFQQQALNDLIPFLDENGENVFVIPAENEAQVSIAVTNLTALAENYDVVLVGTASLPKLKSIQTENFHRVKLHFVTPTFIDFNTHLTRRFIGRYRETFSGEPSQFSYQGFDVTYYFLNALFRYGKDFRDCMVRNPMQLTQMEFSFKKVAPMGGFMNNGLFVTSWERNFDILNSGIIK